MPLDFWLCLLSQVVGITYEFSFDINTYWLCIALSMKNSPEVQLSHQHNPTVRSNENEKKRLLCSYLVRLASLVSIYNRDVFCFAFPAQIFNHNSLGVGFGSLILLVSASHIDGAGLDLSYSAHLLASDIVFALV